MRNMARRPDGGTEKEQTNVAFSVTLVRMMKTLWRPELKQWRFRMVLAFSLTVLAKILAVAAPVFLGNGINGLGIEGSQINRTALSAFFGMVLLYGLMRFLSNALPQVRDSFFVRVTQNMNRVIAHEAFLHAQRQSLHSHLTRRAGALNRVIERGSGAMEFLLRFLVFNIGPTFVELAMAASVVGVLYGFDLAAVVVFTVLGYVVFTVIITEWRNKLRRVMNVADTELKAITMDTFSNFETVKAFAAEEREASRFDGAMQNFIHHYVRSMKSMNVMNAGQEFIMSAGLVAVIIVAGYAIQRGDMRIGDIRLF